MFKKKRGIQEKMGEDAELERRYNHISVYRQADITSFLKARAGQIITRALQAEHIPQEAREVMDSRLVRGLVRSAFKDVAVDCLAAYFGELEERRPEVLDEIIRTTRSKYGTRLRVLQGALEKRTGHECDLIDILEKQLTPQVYLACVHAVRSEFSAYKM
jgi:hypothetical protein